MVLIAEAAPSPQPDVPSEDGQDVLLTARHFEIRWNGGACATLYIRKACSAEERKRWNGEVRAEGRDEEQHSPIEGLKRYLQTVAQTLSSRLSKLRGCLAASVSGGGRLLSVVSRAEPSRRSWHAVGGGRHEDALGWRGPGATRWLWCGEVVGGWVSGGYLVVSAGGRCWTLLLSAQWACSRWSEE